MLWQRVMLFKTFRFKKETPVSYGHDFSHSILFKCSNDYDSTTQ